MHKIFVCEFEPRVIVIDPVRPTEDEYSHASSNQCSSGLIVGQTNIVKVKVKVNVDLYSASS